MNPAWFLVGLQIGDRLAPVLRKPAKRLVRETYWQVDRGVIAFGQHVGRRIDTRLGHLIFRAWVRSLP